MNVPWEIALATGAVVYGLGVSVACAVSIRRMGRPEPDPEVVASAIASAPPLPVRSAAGVNLENVRAVAIDAMSVLAEISDRRNPWREIARRSVSPLDPRRHPGPLSDYARASGVWWDPSWTEDLAAELRSMRLRPGALTALDELCGLGYRLALIGCVPMEHAAALRALFGGRFEAAVFSSEQSALRPGRELLQQLLSDLGAAPTEVLLIGDTFASSLADAEGMGLPVMHFERSHVELPHRVVSLAAVVEQLGRFPRKTAKQSKAAADP
ncbi:HAD family hydrolase [Frigidibacter sp. MR17.24]|uniref:HAD family hydrolase n=1 Tax=Frigidibacter sp. MR17.24 TaxID=3127345 RepID=UPI003012F79C